MKYLISITFIFTLSLAVFGQQNSSNQSDKQKTDEKPADVAITGNVTAEELVFEIVPETDVEFTGNSERETVWEADRENLPEEVKPNVIYRDIGVRLKITSVFKDIDKIVDEALGKTPPKEEADSEEKSEEKPKEETETKTEPEKVDPF